MIKRHLPFYVLAAAILFVGAVVSGVPTSSLWVVGFMVLCPLMTIFMMGGMPGGDGQSWLGGNGTGGVDVTKDRDPRSRPGR